MYSYYTSTVTIDCYIWSVISCRSWIIPIFWKGFKRDLEEEDLFEPLKEHSSGVVGRKLEKYVTNLTFRDFKSGIIFLFVVILFSSARNNYWELLIWYPIILVNLDHEIIQIVFTGLGTMS